MDQQCTFTDNWNLVTFVLRQAMVEKKSFNRLWLGEHWFKRQILCVHQPFKKPGAKTCLSDAQTEEDGGGEDAATEDWKMAADAAAIRAIMFSSGSQDLFFRTRAPLVNQIEQFTPGSLDIEHSLT